MESISSYIKGKMKFRKFLMIVFSVCCILLICGILSSVLEGGTPVDESYGSETVYEQQKVDTALQRTPREILMDKRDKKVRMYITLGFFLIMSASFFADILFVRCPVCSKHIAFDINPSGCRSCGSSFLRKESEK